MNKNKKGFTIVEILIVFIVIGIIIGLVVTTFSDFRRKSRNSERQTDVKTIQQAVENYYAQNETYPTLSQINDSTWRAKNLKGVTDKDLTDPSNDSPNLSSLPVAGAYSYVPTASDGNTCDNFKVDCVKYTITATQEGDVDFIKNNYN